MNDELIKAVRDLKLQNLANEEIKDRLQTQFAAKEIEKALFRLRDMSTISLAINSTSDAPTSQQEIKKKLSRVKIVLLVVFILLIATAAVPSSLKEFSKGETDRIIKALSKRYDTSEYHILGSTNECVKQGPTGFGEVTGLSNCYRITAVVYYPRITVSDYTQPDGLTMVSYVFIDENNKAKNEHISSLMPVRDSKTIGKVGIEKELGLNTWDNLIISGISNKHDTTDKTRIDGIWSWSSTTSWLGINSSSSKLQAAINAKIHANSKLVENAPSPTEALSNGRAPLVVYIKDRYCHSPDVLLLDYVCMLPN